MEILDSKNSNHNGDGILPNAIATLVLGILSIIGCLFYGIFGVILGIIALVLHQKDKRLYETDKEFYKKSYATANGGYVCAIIGVSLSAVFIIGIVIFISSFAGSLGKFN